MAKATKDGKTVNISPTAEALIHIAREEADIYKKRYHHAVKDIEDLKRELGISRNVDGLMDQLVPVDYHMDITHDKEAIPFAIASDWHIDEVVDMNAVGGLNEFNLAVARERVKLFFNYILRLIEVTRRESSVERLILAALGDFMSAWIHEELLETNSLSPTEAVMELLEMWISGLDLLEKESGVKEILFVGAVGNHTRTTKLPQSKNVHKKSYEFLLYNFLARTFAHRKSTKVKFKLPTGYFNWLTVFGKDIRFHHGDRVNYQGGVGGVHIPLRKAIAQWNKARPAFLDIIGHWHFREPSGSYVINGSLIGWNEFAEKIKADYQLPQQAFFLLHPRFGKTAEYPVILESSIPCLT